MSSSPQGPGSVPPRLARRPSNRLGAESAPLTETPARTDQPVGDVPPGPCDVCFLEDAASAHALLDLLEELEGTEVPEPTACARSDPSGYAGKR